MAGKGTLKGVPVVAFGMKSVDLTTDSMKNFGTWFFYKQKVKEEANLPRTIFKFSECT